MPAEWRGGTDPAGWGLLRAKGYQRRRRRHRRRARRDRNHHRRRRGRSRRPRRPAVPATTAPAVAATAAIVPTAAAAALGARAGFVDSEGSAVVLLAVHGFDGGVRLRIVHFDKAEAFRSSGFIRRDCRFGGTELRERLKQIVLADAVPTSFRRKVAYSRCSSFSAAP